MALYNPAVAFQNVQRAGKRSAVHGKDLAEKSLGYFACEGKGLQDGELRGAQSQGAQGVVIELGEDARCTPQVGAHTRKGGNGRTGHAELDAYTSIRVATILPRCVRAGISALFPNAPFLRWGR